MSLDYGNVPSWVSAAFSTLTVSIAAGVVLRESRLRRSQQVENVGIWATFSELDKKSIVANSQGFYKHAEEIPDRVVPEIHVKNGSNLPVVIEHIEYTVTYVWSLEDSIEGFIWTSEQTAFTDEIFNFTAPPAQETVIRGEAHNATPCPQPPKGPGVGDITPEAPGCGTTVDKVVLRDNKQNRWEITSSGRRPLPKLQPSSQVQFK